jgi:hypothetical protein
MTGRGGHRRSTRCAVTAGVAAVVISTFASACGGKQLDVSRAEDTIRSEVERAYEVEVEDVSCPQDVEAEAGATFRCVVSLPDDRLTIDVEQEDDEGRITIEPAQAVISLANVEQAIRRQYNANEVDCGPRRLWVSMPGRTFECTARDEEGGTGTIVVTVQDSEGNIELDVAPESR